MKAVELRALALDELKKRLADEEENLANLRFQLATSQLESPIKVRTVALGHGVEVTTEQKSAPDELVGLRMAKGTLYHRHRYVDNRIYHIKNKDAKDRTVIVEQSYTDDWKLIEPAKPDERATNLSRFRVAAPAGKVKAQAYRQFSSASSDMTLNLRTLIQALLTNELTTDALTGIPNRRQMDEQLEEAIHNATNVLSMPACLALADLDHFKRINDTYGHAIGDEVLKSFAPGIPHLDHAVMSSKFIPSAKRSWDRHARRARQARDRPRR